MMTMNSDEDDDHANLHLPLVKSPAPHTKVVSELVGKDALGDDSNASLYLPPRISYKIFDKGRFGGW